MSHDPEHKTGLGRENRVRGTFLFIAPEGWKRLVCTLSRFPGGLGLATWQLRSQDTQGQDRWDRERWPWSQVRAGGAFCLQADWLREGNPTTLWEEERPLPTLELGRAAVSALLWNTTVSLPLSERGESWNWCPLVNLPAPHLPGPLLLASEAHPYVLASVVIQSG